MALLIDAQQLDKYRQQLLQMQQALVDDAEADQAQLTQLEQAPMGRLSHMDPLQLQQMALQIQRRDQSRAQSIQGALRRIEHGDFGFCFVCDTPITRERLDFDPTITRCAQCMDLLIND